MSYLKTIICLASSKKRSGLCIAGKEIHLANASNPLIGDWIRPVSQHVEGALSEYETWYSDGEAPQVLDLITVALQKPHPHLYQKENHLIDGTVLLKKAGVFHYTDLSDIVDRSTDDLWANGYSSRYGVNDRMPENITQQFNDSLRFIPLKAITLHVATEPVNVGQCTQSRRRMRASFEFNRQLYKLSVTDLRVEQYLFRKPEGDYPIRPNRLLFACISLSELHHGFCYKLVASIITKSPAHASATLG